MINFLRPVAGLGNFVQLELKGGGQTVIRRTNLRDLGVVAGALLVLIQGGVGATVASAQNASTATASASRAETAADAPTADPQNERLDEVVVTSQLRKERLQDVPISVQVVNGQALTDNNVNSLVSLAESTPAVHVGGSAGRINEIAIRGLTGGNTQSFDQPVGIFTDGIYHGRSRVTTSTFLDLERVEILKGPQSTFFGNNAIAGAFNLVTRGAGNEFDAWTRALYGEDGQYALEGAVGGPVTDTFGVRVAATFNGMDGWLENVNTNEDQPAQKNIGGRLTFAFNPSDALDMTLKVSGSRNRDESGLLLQLAGCPAPAPFDPVIGFCAVALALDVPRGLDIDRNSVNDGQESNLDTRESVLTLNYASGGHTFTSVTGYQEYDYNLNLDADLTPLELLHIQAPEDYDQLSQEFRIVSAAGRPLEYLGGVYFQKGHLNFAQRFNYFLLDATIAGIPAFAGLVPYLPLGQQTRYSQTEESYAAFGSVTWNVTDRLKLTGGIRGSWVDKESTWKQFFATATQTYGGLVPLPDAVAPLGAALGQAFGLGQVGTRQGSRSDHAWMPSAKVQYRFNTDVMAYASYARGFLAGGFNGAGTLSDGNEPFDPEFVDAYEVGLKSEWLDGKLLLNVAVFHSDYKDLQVTVNQTTPTGAFINGVRNAAASVSEGVELETRWDIVESFRLTAAVSYLDAHYVRWDDAGPTQLETFCRSHVTNAYCIERFPNGLATLPRAGQQRPYAPKWSGSLAGSYVAHLPGDYRLITELSALYSANYYPNVLGIMDFGYTRYDARLTLETPGGHWSFDAIGKNLSDEIIPTVFAGQAGTNGSQTIQKEQPRNFAVQARYRW